MEGADALGRLHDPTGGFQGRPLQGGIEDVLMQAAVLGIAQRAGAELFRRPGQHIPAQVVQREDFLKMGEIVLAGVPVEIGLQVGEGGHGSPVVEGLVRVGQDQHQRAAGAHDAAPFGQRSEWVGDMLKAVRGEDEIVAFIGEAVQPGGLAEELAAGRLVWMETKRALVAQTGLLGGL